MSVRSGVLALAGGATVVAALGAAVSASARSRVLFDHPAAGAMTAAAPFAGAVGAAGLATAGLLAVAGKPRLAAGAAAASLASLAASRGRIRLGQVPSSPLPLSHDDVRIYVHNILTSNRVGGEQLGEQISSENPDVVVLIEANQENIAGARSGLRQYPYIRSFNLDGAHGNGEKHPDGVLIASKFPLGPLTAVPGAGRPCVSGVLEIRGRAVRLVAVHTRAPVNRSWAQEWLGNFRRLGDYVSACGERDLWVVGDLNAERGHAPFRDFVRNAGLADASDSVPTWPASKRLPRLLGLDHVLVRGDLVPVRVRLGRACGSDHVPVIVDMGGPRLVLNN